MKLHHIVAMVAFVWAACVSTHSRPDDLSGPAGLRDLPLTDAPYDLASDRDLEDVRDQFEALDLDDPGRGELRRQLAEEYDRRMAAAIERPHTHEDAYDWLLELFSLWTGPELADDTAIAAQLSPYNATVDVARRRFSRAGRDIEATAALYYSSLADPDHRDQYLREIDDIFAYDDRLALTQFGHGAQASRPITILEAIVERVQVPRAVDRLAELYVARQTIISNLFSQRDRRMQLIQAHGAGVLRTAWHLLRVFARARRLADVEPYLARFQGIGWDSELVEAVRASLAENASAAAWGELIQEFQDAGDTKEDDDEATARQRAVLALCRQAEKRFPRSAQFSSCAGDAARQLDLLHVAIKHYENAMARAPDDRDLADQLAELYRVRVSTLAFYERPLAAREHLRELEAFHAKAAARWPDKPLASDLADAYTAMGRGMIGIGELAAAEKYLQKSLASGASAAALEQLGTIAFKQDRFDEAVRYYERALALEPASTIDEYNRARIYRLAGDALARAGHEKRAADRWKQALISWMELDSKLDLPPAYQGELMVESGKAQWALGDPDTALLAFDRAVDVDMDGADTHSSVVSFLIVRGHYQRALDAFHRALGSHEISSYSKVYMALWVLAESRRNGEPPDVLAVEYLASRKGRLWYDELARFATHRADRTMLERKATTRGRQAEMLYYSAVLDDSRKRDDVRADMKRVISTDMVLFYEYDMAKYWLSEGFVRRTPADSP